MSKPRPTNCANDADRLTAQYSLQNSFAGKIGHVIEPVIRPLGYDWQIGIGIFSSFAAREVIVSTLAIVYGVGEDAADNNQNSLYDTLRRAKRTDGSPVFTDRDVPEPAGVLHSGGAMPLHHRRRPARDELLEVAAVSDRLHDRSGLLCRRAPGLSNFATLRLRVRNWQGASQLREICFHPNKLVRNLRSMPKPITIFYH